MLIKYIKSVFWRVAKRLSYIEDARCLKVNPTNYTCNDNYLLFCEAPKCVALAGNFNDSKFTKACIYNKCCTRYAYVKLKDNVIN